MPVDLTKSGPPPGVLGALRPAPLLAPVDTTEPLLPGWARDRAAVLDTLRRWAKRTAYRAGRLGLRLPAVLGLLVLYSPRGLGRLVALLGRWVYDQDTAKLRHEHAGRGETPEAVKAQAMRRANLHARWIVAACVALPLVVPVLAWTAPSALAVVVALAVFVAVVKLIPGRGWQECVGAAVAAGAAWWYTPQVAGLIPAPPAWVPVVAVPGAVLALGWLGRPAGRGLVGDSRYAMPAELVKPTADMVTDALVAAVPGITEKNREDVRWHAPGVARARGGYHLAGELVPGVTTADVIEQREAFAAALRRPMGCVWPSRGPMHPGHFRLFIGDEPMATADQDRWPLAAGKRLDIFAPMPLFTDQEGRWFEQMLAYRSFVIGGAPGYGKSFALRELGVAAAFDPRVRIRCYDGKGNGDLRPLRAVADEFYEGDEPEDVAAQLRSVQAARQEMRRRAAFLRELPAAENPEDKVTSTLVDRYRHLAPIVLLFDEVQVYTEHEDKATREAFIVAIADLVRRGRSAGIIVVLCTQKPSATVIPTSITDNCSVRLCFRVNGQRANDAVLGTEMHSAGVKATKFGPDDRGLAWLKGDGTEPLVVRTVFGLDKPAAEALLAKARAIREAAGLLTGYAAGEPVDTGAEVDLVDDVREVMREAGADRMHLVTLLDALALLRPGLYGPIDVEGLGSALRAAGVQTGQVKVDRTNRQGVRLAALDGSDDDGGELASVTPIG